MQAQVFEVDFESGIPGNWSQEINGGSGEWTAATGAWDLDFGSTTALFDDDAQGEASTDDNVELVTPVIPLSEGTATLNFDYANIIFELESSLEVQVYDGSEWHSVFSVTGDAFDEENLFLNESIDVSAYANNEFQVSFIYDDGGDWSYGAIIDNVSVDGELSNNDFTISGFNHFYTPSNEELTINATDAFESISIYNLLGQNVLSKDLDSNSEKISLASINTGVYVINVNANGKTNSFKLVKN